MTRHAIFYPKIISTLKEYSSKQFFRDLIAGVIVGIVSVPLAIAFGIASGASPTEGIITAIIAGFLISLFGGSRVQIGGPTGAFIVIVYEIIQTHGYAGLLLATAIGGVFLILLGFAKLGSLIKFIPEPVIVGFTSGIAVVLFSSQIKDFFGMPISSLPNPFWEKWVVYFEHVGLISLSSTLIGITTIAIVYFVPRFFPRTPGTFIALLLTTGIVVFFQIPVETVGSRFGALTLSLSEIHFFNFDFANIKELLSPAISITLLGGIESLMCCVIADGMIGGKHRPNTELVAQGIANVCSSIFGGLPATGAIARTVTNIKNGGRTPIAGVIHSIVVLSIVLFFAPFLQAVPMATIAGILIVVAYNMSEWREFVGLLKFPRADGIIILITFFLTIFVDLIVAIQVGVVLSVFLFMKRMSDVSQIKKMQMGEDPDADKYYSRSTSLSKTEVPEHVEVFEISGAFFFGASGKFMEVLMSYSGQKKFVILRMNQVFVLDLTGVRMLEKFAKEAQKAKTKVLFAELHSSCRDVIQRSRLPKIIGEGRFFKTLSDAISYTKQLTL